MSGLRQDLRHGREDRALDQADSVMRFDRLDVLQ